MKKPKKTQKNPKKRVFLKVCVPLGKNLKNSIFSKVSVFSLFSLFSKYCKKWCFFDYLYFIKIREYGFCIILIKKDVGLLILEKGDWFLKYRNRAKLLAKPPVMSHCTGLLKNDEDGIKFLLT